MPGNSFILFKGDTVVEGESPQAVRPGKDGWIEISDWSWDIEAEHSNLKGTGAAVGKPNPGTLSITHPYDTSSTAIMTRIVKGTIFKTVYIDMLKQTGEEKAEQFFQICMSDVYITKVSTKGGEDGTVTQDVEMVFKEVAVGYKAQDNKGVLTNPPLEFEWSIAKMISATSDARVVFK